MLYFKSLISWFGLFVCVHFLCGLNRLPSLPQVLTPPHTQKKRERRRERYLGMQLESGNQIAASRQHKHTARAHACKHTHTHGPLFHNRPEKH